MPHKAQAIQDAIQEANTYFTSGGGLDAARAATTSSDLVSAISDSSYGALKDAVQNYLDTDQVTALFHHVKAAAEIGTSVQFLWNDRPGVPQSVSSSHTTGSPMEIVVHADGSVPPTAS